MMRMLASVTSLDEARTVARHGVDIIDLKNPQEGALGALPIGTVRAIVDELKGHTPLSATVGDLPMQPEHILAVVEAVAATGVDFVKVGFFPDGNWNSVIDSLRPVTARGINIVAVFFADHHFDFKLLAALAKAGFKGAMLDTADKQNGSLTMIRDADFLYRFVGEARQQGLFCGLAGSLRLEDIAPLASVNPDYLGFRGALCGGKRTEQLNSIAVTSVLDAIRAVSDID
jgi:uncharacterized protein (UPF0264 family)